jgi:hypothetical protein
MSDVVSPYARWAVGKGARADGEWEQGAEGQSSSLAPLW